MRPPTRLRVRARPRPRLRPSPMAKAAGRGQGQRGGHGAGGGWGGGWAGGGGIVGTVTEAAADHYTIKTDAGEIYVIHFSANTQILKQMAERRGEGGGGNREESWPQIIKPGEIKAGDAVAAMGEVNAGAKSVGATRIVLIDPERAKQMREMAGQLWQDLADGQGNGRGRSQSDSARRGGQARRTPSWPTRTPPSASIANP